MMGREQMMTYLAGAHLLGYVGMAVTALLWIQLGGARPGPPILGLFAVTQLLWLGSCAAAILIEVATGFPETRQLFGRVAEVVR